MYHKKLKIMKLIAIDISTILLVLIMGSVSNALDNGVGLTPVLGWNTWKTCGDEGCSHDYCDEHEVQSAAQAMIDNGMQALGWNYINLDDCWAYSRDNVTNQLTWDTDRFPNGMDGLATWLHDRNFKFGLYTSAGDATCSSGGRPITVPGSEGYYTEDAQAFASWGVDYVKLDWCGDVKDKFVIDGIEDGKNYHKEFAAALNATGRPMFLEIVAGYWFLKHETSNYANSWRFCTDHHDEYESTVEAVGCRLDQGERPMNLTRGESGSWPYLDFLMTGGNGCSPYIENVEGMHCPGQSDDNYILEFSVWSITQSPMIFATDPRNMTNIMTKALLNEEIIQAHQSIQTPPGQLVAGGRFGTLNMCNGCEVYARYIELENDEPSTLVVFVNWKNVPNDITVTFEQLGITGSNNANVRDLWTHEDWTETISDGQVTAQAVPAGGAVMLKLTNTN